MRKLMTRGLLVAAVALGGIAVAGAASASPVDMTTEIQGRPLEDMPDTYVAIDMTENFGDCVQRGTDGVRDGRWRAWFCENDEEGVMLWAKY